MTHPFMHLRNQPCKYLSVHITQSMHLGVRSTKRPTEVDHM